MPTDIMAFRRATFMWEEIDIVLLHETWLSTMEDLSKITPIKSKEFSSCLERGSEVIIEKMIDLILSPTYIKPPDGSEKYSLNWQDAPHFMAKFLQQLETVFTGDKEIKIRHKILRHYAVKQTPAKSAENQMAKHWNDADIETLSDACESAMKSLENNPAIMSSEYKQCLQKERNIIINTMMKFIMDTENFPKHSLSSQYILEWESAPKALATILHHSETVFTRNEEFHIGKKGIMFPKNDDLVHLVREPDRRQKCGILKTYGKIESFSAKDKFHLKVLQGKRIWDEEWVEEGETYNLIEEANAMLCMHLWSLRKYAGDESYENIWNDIKNGWPECVSWETGPAGKFWKIIVPDQLPSWVVDGYEEMEKYFKEDSEHSCVESG